MKTSNLLGTGGLSAFPHFKKRPWLVPASTDTKAAKAQGKDAVQQETAGSRGKSHETALQDADDLVSGHGIDLGRPTVG